MKELVLGDSLEVLIDHRGKTPKKLGADFVEDGVPVASAILVNNGTLNLDDARYVSEDVYRKWMPVSTRKGDVLLTSEAPLGRVARVPSDAPLVLGQRLFGLRGKPGVLDTGFLYYALQTERLQNELVGRSTGTTVVGIRQSALRGLRLLAPAYDEQLAIVRVLGALDDKIAANRRSAATADAYVRAVWEESAKSSQESIALGAIADLRRTQVDPRDVEPSTPYVGLEHIPRRMLWLDDAGAARDVTSGKSVFRRGDVLFGKLRPYFHKVVGAPLDGICSTDILVLQAKDTAMAGFVLAAAASDDVVAASTAASSGTRMPRASWKYLSSIEVPWPGDARAAEISDRVTAIKRAMGACSKENVVLAATRDALLPGLMSGKLRVRDAERVAEEVA